MDQVKQAEKKIILSGIFSVQALEVRSKVQISSFHLRESTPPWNLNYQMHIYIYVYIYICTYIYIVCLGIIAVLIVLLTSCCSGLLPTSMSSHCFRACRGGIQRQKRSSNLP